MIESSRSFSGVLPVSVSHSLPLHGNTAAVNSNTTGSERIYTANHIINPGIIVTDNVKVNSNRRLRSASDSCSCSSYTEAESSDSEVDYCHEIVKELSSPMRKKQGQMQAAPINLTWIVLFTLFICALSLFLDDVFAPENLKAASDIEYNYNLDYVWRKSQEGAVIMQKWMLGGDIGSNGIGIEASYVDEPNDSINNIYDNSVSRWEVERDGRDYIRIVIATKAKRQREAIIHGGACMMLLAILSIWALAAYIALSYITESTNSQELLRVRQESINITGLKHYQTGVSCPVKATTINRSQHETHQTV